MSERVIQPPPQRVAPFLFPESYSLPGRPSRSEGPLAQDAYKQTQFLLGQDLQLFESAMNLQLRIVADSYPSKYRTHRLAAVLAFWSRAFLHLADACLLATRGSYVSSPTLVRAACDCVAAQKSLLENDFEEFFPWLGEALKPNAEHKALAFDLGRFRGAAALAGENRLGAVYRLATSFSLTHFGPTFLQSAPDSDRQKIAVVFADRAFHIGWAELILGWLLTVADVQLGVALGAGGILAISQEVKSEGERLSRQIEELLAKPQRCYIEEIVEGGEHRYLIHNFRRAASGAPKKVLI